MAAWVFGEDENPVHGFDDCGESGAGQALLQLLLHRRNRLTSDRLKHGVLVVVTRWYGGAHLGGARFRVSWCCDARCKILNNESFACRQYSCAAVLVVIAVTQRTMKLS
eukprot:m.151772 g.151772  ORF g.151772 m.151772 type:complete len:109 (+) comp17874_c0_seq1:648-974(+)